MRQQLPDPISRYDDDEVIKIGVQPEKMKRPFFHYLLLSMIGIVLIVASGITVIDYLNARANYEKNADFLEIQTEQNIIRSIEVIDAGFRLFDDSQNERLVDGFTLFMAEYERTGRNPAAMDLPELKSRIGRNADLYIINDSGVIEFTTYAPDQNLDFKKTPYFYEYLQKIRLSEGYFSDRVVHEINTNQIRKYAYMPTPDHRYILEIGMTGPLYNNQHSFETYQKNIDEIVYLNPFVRDVRIYDTLKKPVNSTAVKLDAATEADLDRVIADRTGMTITDEAAGTKITYLFVDLYDRQYGSDVSRIVRISYDTSIIQKQLNDLLLAHFIAASLAMLIGIFAAVLLSRFFARPVNAMVTDVDIIAHGDLGHPVSIPDIGREFAVLGESVSTMVAALTEAIDREKESTNRYHRLVENIPDVIWTTRSDGKTVFISRNIERIYGFTPEEIYEKGTTLFFDRIHPADTDTVQKAFARLFEQKTYDIEYRIRRKDGAWIWLHDRSTAVYETNGERYADGIFSDVTERRNTQEKLRQLSDELENRVETRTAELQKTEAAFRQANKKLNLLSSITRHDILNQVTILTGYLKLAGTRTTDSEIQKYLVTAQKAAGVIDRHMVFTRLYQDVGIHAPAWQNVSRVLQKVREDFSHEPLDLQVETGSLELYADPLLEKVFFTLLENTIRHGERATVARLTYTLGEESLTIFYEDDGVGISPDEKERIFEWGYGRHTGFGLFLSREILAITGLLIRETGLSGRGARFEITVPREAYRFPPRSGQQQDDQPRSRNPG